MCAALFTPLYEAIHTEAVVWTVSLLGGDLLYLPHNEQF